MEIRSKYVQAVKEFLIRESSFPSVKLVRFFADQVYPLNVTEQVIDEFGPIVKEALHHFVGGKTAASSVQADRGTDINSRHLISDEEFESFYVVNVAEHI